MRHGRHIAVCGAGVGGLAAATLLARAGHRVTVFDQFDAPRPVGSGLMLQTTGLAVLRAMGLAGQVIALGSRIGRLWGATTPSNRAVLDVRFSRLKDGVFALGVQRPALFAVLFAAAEAEGVEIVTATRIAAADPHVGTVTDAAGRAHGGFDLVVDALGARSPLSSDPKRELAYGALWATLPWPENAPFDAAALEQRYRAARKMAGVMASGRMAPGGPVSLTYFWSIRAADEAGWRRAPLEAWKDEARTLWPETQGLLDQLTDHPQLAFARYRHRTHARPVAGPRLVHIGDAWHASSPQLGQGANMALLDAYALALALERDGDVASALVRYSRLRQGHIRLYQAMSWLFTPVYQGDGRAIPFLRDHLAAPLSRVPPAPKLLAALVTGAFGSPLKKLGLSADLSP